VPDDARPRRWPAAILDIAAIAGFVLAGRASHDETDALTGFLRTAWPFAVGALLGWAIARVRRRPATVWPAGVSVWLATWLGGLALRAVSDQGVAPAFVAVAGVVLAVLLVGWRIVAAVASRRRPDPRRAP
jgi:peptidoglycan/LPS O-acetylase OafA/YrhL